jgi:hypothetical protein
MKLKLTLPKTINTTLELDKLGVDSDLRNEDLVSLQFPEILPPHYLELWSEFIDTQSAKDLFESYVKPIGLMYCAVAFVSYVANIDSVKYYDIERFSRQSLVRHTTDIVSQLKPIFKQKLFYKLPLINVQVKIDESYNEVVNAYSAVKGNVYLVLGNNKDKKRVGDELSGKYTMTTLSEELYKHSSYMFGNSQPPNELLGVKNKATGERKFTKQSNLTKIKHFDWSSLEFGKLKAYATRNSENTLALRIPIEFNMLYFVGSDRPSMVHQRIENQIKQALRKLYV